MLGRHSLKLRFPQAARFSGMVFGMGSAGGALGHRLFVGSAGGPLQRRALVVGAEVGLATSLSVWAVTNIGRRWLSPFEPGEDAQQVLVRSVGPAVVAGPLAGMGVSRLVIARLRDKYGLNIQCPPQVLSLERHEPSKSSHLNWGESGCE